MKYGPKLVMKYPGVDGKSHQKTINPNKPFGGLTWVTAGLIVAGGIVALLSSK